MDNKLNLASARFGATITEFSDDFFAACERMLQDSEPVFIDDKFDDHGKWMDGWESRRRRHGGHDYAIIKLAFDGMITDIDIDTRHFTGNFPPQAAVEACYCTETPTESDWFPLIKKCEIKGDDHNLIPVKCDEKISHVRLSIYPDGGVARLRIFGSVAYSPPSKNSIVEISGLGYGGKILAYNDAHYGNVQSLLAADKAKDMGDGWETRRRRTPGHDWLIASSDIAAVIKNIEIDTAFYKGNFPAACSIQAACIKENKSLETIVKEAENWETLLPKQELSADNVHKFNEEILTLNTQCNHFRLNIFPDGGIARLRIFGKCT